MSELEFVDHCQVNFHDHSYRWFSRKQFRWEGIGDDCDVLAALIHHWRFRDTYLTAEELDSQNVHGPYFVGKITPASFERIDPAKAGAVIDEFCQLDRLPPSPAVDEQIGSMIRACTAAKVCYRLSKLSTDAVHEFGFILLAEFRELVLISHVDRTLFLIVMAID